MDFFLLRVFTLLAFHVIDVVLVSGCMQCIAHDGGSLFYETLD